jgi:putative ABC transport system permease protein
MRHLWSDLRFGLRHLRRETLFTGTAFLTLTLGVGATVTLFSIVNAVLIQPPVFDHPETIVRLYETRETRPGVLSNMAWPDVVDVRNRSTTLADVSEKQYWAPTILDRGDPARLLGASVMSGFFDILGVQPVLGRFFTADEGELGHEPLVVLGHHVWVGRFGADSSVIGATVNLSEALYTVIGVAPAGFEDAEGQFDLWRSRPSHFSMDVQSRTGHSMRPIARIMPGYTLDQVNADLASISAGLLEEYPDDKAGDGFVAVPLMEVIVGSGRRAILTLFGAVTVLLLIACANVANLLLSRAAARQREFAVRTALGAGPKRLISQLLTENVLLATMGGLGGITLAFVAVRLLGTFTTGIPRADRVQIDGMVLLFALAATGVVGILFGLMPALHASRTDLVADLKDGMRGASSGVRGLALKNGLVVAEIALALVLLTSAGLLTRSLVNIRDIDPGVRVDNVLTMNVDPSTQRYPAHSDLTRYWDQVVRGVEAIPGVVHAGAVSFLPLSGGFEGQGIRRADQPPLPPGQGLGAEARAVTLDYFATLGIELQRGRLFTTADDSASASVLVINEALAGVMFPGEDPLGKSIVVQRVPREIVGIVSDVRQFGVLADTRSEIYAPHAQPFVSWIRATMDLAIHVDGDAMAVAATVQRKIWEIDTQVPISDVRTMALWAADDIAAPRFRTYILGLFSTVALALAAVGIAGVLMYAVSHRTREFGVRVAIGATQSDLLALTFRHGLKLIVAGLALGLIGSFVATRALRSILFDIEPTDPLTMAAVTGLLGLIAIIAVLVPALRATRVSPLEAMRAD